jgi:hypothetical protein
MCILFLECQEAPQVEMLSTELLFLPDVDVSADL